uniref:TPR_REGION domain-containing protein n=1 Tax=Bursaphelenchus xylophilus TaxID=6326 RepID=A0A1I7RNV5_BURXY
MSNSKRSKKAKPKSVPVEALFSNDDLPPEVTNHVRIDSESGEFVFSGTMHVAPQKELNDDDAPGPSKGPRARRTNKAIDGLMGQANVACANQRFEEALSLLKEAIRQEPRDPDPYQQMADIYLDLGDEIKSLEFRLLACHLNQQRTNAAEWAEVGETAVRLGRMEVAAACYGNAIRNEPSNWIYYEKRIELLETLGITKFAMKIRLQAAQSVDCQTSNVDFDWMQKLIQTAAEYYIDCLDEEKATEALKIFLLRCHEFGRMADVQHLALLGMWMGRKKYDECVKSVLALCADIKALDADGKTFIKITVSHKGYTFTPADCLSQIHAIEVPDTFNTLILAKLIVCLQHLGYLKPIPSLLDVLLARAVHQEDEIVACIEIGKTFHQLEYFNNGVLFMERLVQMDLFAHHPEVLHLCGLFEQARNNLDKALEYYRDVLEIQPNFVNARINLSTVLQKLGRSEEALQALMDYDLDLCTQLPDERLLIRQADVLKGHKQVEQYIRCLRMLLIPYFYPIYKFQNFTKRSRTKLVHCSTLYRTMIEAMRGTQIERLIKRLGAIAYSEERQDGSLGQTELHDYCLMLVEAFHETGRYIEMAEIVYLANMQPELQKSTITTFMNLVLYSSLKAKHYGVAFEYLRNLYANMPAKVQKLEFEDKINYQERIYNAMNYVFVRDQNIAYHRFIMRAEAKFPEEEQLQMISGNNSLVTGSYRHALSEYLKLWVKNPEDPMACLLVGLTFVHMSCKKDISSRQMLLVRGMAFMSKYQKFRGGPNQETMYNMARMLHQVGILAGAIYFYEKVLHETEAPIIQTDFGEVETGHKYDLKRLAAHNLALIYETSGNLPMARHILETFCVIE